MITLLETQVVSADNRESSTWLFTSFSDNTHDHGGNGGKWCHSEPLMDSDFENPSPPCRGHRSPLRLSHNYSCSILKRFACKTQLPFFKGIMKCSPSVLNIKVQISVYVFSHQVVLVVEGCAHLATRTEKRKAHPQLFSPGVEFVDPRFQDFLFFSSIYEFNFQFQICKDLLRV